MEETYPGSVLRGVKRTAVNNIESWKEVMEREALNKFFSDEPDSATVAPVDKNIDYTANLASKDPTRETSTRGLQRLDVLHRHGRECVWQDGWDGSPSEIQPFFCQTSYLSAAHKFGDHNENAPRTKPSLSEVWAHRLLRAKDFRPEACHQLLDAVDLMSVKRGCLEDKGRSGAVALGLFSHGGFSGVTRCSNSHKQLSRYFLKYLRFHGMDGSVTSLYVSRNTKAAVHRDCHNLKGSVNWIHQLGRYTGGELWVECRDQKNPPVDATWKVLNGRRVYGFLLDARDQTMCFDPELRHETQPFKGDRYSITAYTSRSIVQADQELRRRLRDLGFLSKAKMDVYFVEVHEDDTEDVDAPVHEAYPLRAWQTPGEGEAAVMESSGDEGADRTQEPLSRVQKQALKKELPWRAMSAEEIPKFAQALVDEWAEWQKWSSCRLMCLLQWSSTNQVDLLNGDCQSAFLQGAPDDERPTSIFMRPPDDPVSRQAIPEWLQPDLLYKLSAPVYGQANAPRRWYIHVRKVLTELGWITHTLDPCLFLFVEKVKGTDIVVAVLGLHVDDLILACLNGFKHHLDAVYESFTWGKAWESRDFVFVGRRIRQHPDHSITVDQASYVSEVPVTKTKLDPAEPLSNHPELITEFRSGIGSLQWLASTTRGDISADVSLLQRPPPELTVADLLEINAVLRYVKATNDAYYKIVSVPWNDMLLVAYGDSGFGNAPNGKSQGGLVVVATSKQALEGPQEASLMEWRSYRHQRVLRSTLAAEAASLDKAEDYGNFLAAMLSEMHDASHQATMRAPLIEVLPVTDARSLWDAVHRLTTSFQEKRVEISIAALRQQCRNLRWVPTEMQMADAMTKRSRVLRDQFREWMASPIVTLVESRSPEDISLPGEANDPWRAPKKGGEQVIYLFTRKDKTKKAVKTGAVMSELYDSSRSEDGNSQLVQCDSAMKWHVLVHHLQRGKHPWLQMSCMKDALDGAHAVQVFRRL
ncbi:Copia protein [Symbiodinium microadriaticum]|uniref:Copia protein n=1 Tax=Symbiodinium microadriaticum TaxID=2951 RepID=A0A1Q9EYW5_SYMMI|nr:Copia protein [Symbiodinium microadriaticum]